MKKNIFKVVAGALAVVITLSSTSNVAFAAEPGQEDNGISTSTTISFGSLGDLLNMATEESPAEESVAEESVAEESVAEESVAEEVTVVKEPVAEEVNTSVKTEEIAAVETEEVPTVVETEEIAAVVETEEVVTTTKPATMTETKEVVVAAEPVVETVVSAPVQTYSKRARRATTTSAARTASAATTTSIANTCSTITFGTLSVFKTICFGTLRDLLNMANASKEPVYVTVSTYYCNCSACYHTTDYNALKMHMFQHVLKGEPNSYHTVVDKILQP